MASIHSSNKHGEPPDQPDFATAVMDVVDKTYKPYFTFLWVWLAVVHASIVLWLAVLLIQRKRKTKLTKRMSEVEEAVRFHHQLCSNTIRLRNQDQSQETLSSVSTDSYKPEFVVLSSENRTDRRASLVRNEDEDVEGEVASIHVIGGEGDMDITIERVRTIQVERARDVEDDDVDVDNRALVSYGSRTPR